MGGLDTKLFNITLRELYKLVKKKKYIDSMDNKPLKSPPYRSLIFYIAVLIRI